MPKNTITQQKLASLIFGSQRIGGVPTGLELINPTVLVQAYRVMPVKAVEEVVYAMLNMRGGNHVPPDFLAAALNEYEKVLRTELFPLFASAFRVLSGFDASKEDKKFLQFISFLGNLRDPRSFLEASATNNPAANFAALATGRSSLQQLAKTVLRSVLTGEREEIIPFDSDPYGQSGIVLFDFVPTPPAAPAPEVKEEEGDSRQPKMKNQQQAARFSDEEHPSSIISGQPGRCHLELSESVGQRGYLDVVSDGANLFISATATESEGAILITERFLWLSRWYDFNYRSRDRLPAGSIDLKLASRASVELKRTVVIPVGYMSPYTMAPWLDL